MPSSFGKGRVFAALTLVAAAAIPISLPSCVKEPKCVCDAAIVKFPLGELTAGQPGEYNLLVDYEGAETCEDGDLCVSDTFPAGITCDPTNDAYTHAGTDPNPNWDCTCSTTSVRCCLRPHPLPASFAIFPIIHVPVNVALDAPSPVKNCAQIDQEFQGSFDDYNPANDKSCVATQLAKPRWDLFVSKWHRDPLIPGGTVDWMIAVSNAGPGAATGFTVTDTLPPGFTLVNASSPWSCTQIGPTVTCTLSGSIAPMTSAPLLILTTTVPLDATETEVANCVDVTSDGDGNIQNNKACDKATILLCKTWSEWTDIDDPNATGDWEIVSTNFPQACPKTNVNPTGQPVALECQTVLGQPFPQAVDPTATCALPTGLICIFGNEPDGKCLDYKIRICCP